MLAVNACGVELPESVKIPSNFVVKGPLVEVTPRSGEPFTCIMLEMNSGTVRFELFDGKIREEKTSALRSLRYFEAPSKTGNVLSEKERRFRLADWRANNERIRQLKQMATLSEAEADELQRLQDKTPRLMPAPKLPEIREINDRVYAVKSGQLGAFITEQQKHLKTCDDEDAASRILLTLALCYVRNDIGFVGAVTQLDRDLKSIDNKKVRDSIEERLPRIQEMIARRIDPKRTK
jgi:hypothetical protein